MARKNIAVLDFGTSRVSVMIGDRGINNVFDIKGYGETSYAGYLDGEFLQPETLMQDVQEALACAENNARCKITHLYVGVPAEFSSVVVKKGKLTFDKPHKINDNDIQELFDSVDNFNEEALTVINRAPVYYILDDDCKIIEPKGKVTEEISGTISFVLCETSFLNKVKQILAPLHIQHIEFFSEPLSECLYLVDPEQRDSCAVLVDSGFLTTSVSIVMGDGLLSLRSFSLGAGYIIADFCEVFGLNVEQAERLKRKISLEIEPEEDEVIQLTVGKQEMKQINAKQAYQIVEYRVKQISKMIKKCLNMYSPDLPSYLSLLITGGGISYIQGMPEVVQAELNRSVEIIAPDDPELNQPQLSSALSLLDLAVKQNKQIKNSFFVKLFKKN